jgi:serine/threonine protein kinase
MTGSDFGQYRVGEKLGKGGMGEVYKAEDLALGRTVALKFLGAGRSDPAFEKRFLREAQASAALSHQNICEVYHILHEAGRLCIVMAYIDGGSLAWRLKRGPLSLANALDLAGQISDGLAQAHNKRIVHRDIKPANILLTQQGQVKITDFGVALMPDRSRLTKAGTILGTPSYMSPEQAKGLEADRRSDIWSLAVVLCEMISGRLPFRGRNFQATLRAILSDEPELILPVPGNLKPELERMLRKGLSRIPSERYQHVEDFAVDVRLVRKRVADAPDLEGAPQTIDDSSTTVTLPPKEKPAFERIMDLLRRKP